MKVLLGACMVLLFVSYPNLYFESYFTPHLILFELCTWRKISCHQPSCELGVGPLPDSTAGRR